MHFPLFHRTSLLAYCHLPETRDKFALWVKLCAVRRGQGSPVEGSQLHPRPPGRKEYNLSFCDSQEAEKTEHTGQRIH